jgi:TetR/AcrR family transcriptional regulator, regulator of cefoperazone and chloramphenicol sensitivity
VRRRPAARAAADLETRERLLRAAERLFADRGFKKVTVRDICREARANVAAVNYHFGDKLGLYREVIQIGIDAMRAATEAGRQAGERQPPDEQLRRFLTIWIGRLLTPGHETIHRLMQRELQDPTPAFDEVIDAAVRPRLDYLSAVVARMLDCDPKDQLVLRCVAAAQAPVVAYLPNPIAARLGFTRPQTPAQIDEAAHHIAEFAVAGVKAVARRMPDRAAAPVRSSR